MTGQGQFFERVNAFLLVFDTLLHGLCLQRGNQIGYSALSCAKSIFASFFAGGLTLSAGA